MSTATVDSGVLRSARERAARMARDSSVEVRQIRGDELAAAQTVIGEAWGPQQIPQSNLLQAIAHSGNPVLVAFRHNIAVGVCFGFLGWTDGLHLHSHMTAVTTTHQSTGIGHALKLVQRAVCLKNDITEIRWTYDPLIARNAHFNFVKLGARVNAFFPDFYGDMDDAVNAGDHSDRFEVSWRLDGDEVLAALDGRGRIEASSGDLVTIPSDFAALRRVEPVRAKDIRLSTREEFTRLFSAGLTPRWTDRGYVFVAASESSLKPHKRSQDHA